MKKFLFAIGSIFPIAAIAHPGHGGTDGFTIIHYMREPEHIVLGVLVLAFVYAVVRKKSKSSVKG